MKDPHKLIKIELQGTEAAKQALREWATKATGATGEAMLGEMQDTMKESQDECPYDYENLHEDGTPHLRDTAKSQLFIWEPGQIVVYGSYTTPYAVYVHEILEYHHLYPTKAKYLEDPATRKAGVLLENVKQKLINEGVIS